MNLNLEEEVKLPEALADHLGNLRVRYTGYVSNPENDPEGAVLCHVVWKKRHYYCTLSPRSQSIDLDEQLIEDCRTLLAESVENESEFDWRAIHLQKIDRLVRKGAVRLCRKRSKAQQLPARMRL